MDTATDPTLILAQWFSPLFPVGGFAYSHGLESAVADGSVHDPATLGDWVRDILTIGAGWNDAVFLSAAYQTDDVARLDQLCRAMAASSERLTETVRQGRAFSTAVSGVWPVTISTECLPVAVGQAARSQNLPLNPTLRFYLQAFASNLVSAAMRLAPIGQTEGQRVISDLSADVLVLADRAEQSDLDGLSSIAWLTDVSSMRHETQYSRMFQT